jgi:hypothetical protein
LITNFFAQFYYHQNKFKMPVFHTKTIENILEPVAQQLHLAISVAENFAQRNRPDNVGGGATSNVLSGPGTPRAISSLSEARLHAPSMPMLTLPGHLSSMAAISTPTIHLNNGTLSRASSRKSLAQSEFIYPDTIRQRVTVDDCPVCQILMPKGPHGCVCKIKCAQKN